MFNIKWILSIAQKSPRLALTAVLLVGLAISGGTITFLHKQVIENLKAENKKDKLEIARLNIQNQVLYNRIEYKDSLCNERVIAIQQKANDEVQKFLMNLTNEQSNQIKNQREIAKIRNNIYNKNNVIIKKGDSAIKVLDRGKK